MIFWQGWGIAVFVIWFACFEVGHSHRWPLAAIYAAAGTVTGALALFLRTRDNQVITDPSTGEEVFIRKQHTLMYIPMHWWAVLQFAIAVMLLVGLVR